MNIAVIVVDTLRYDYVGAHGNDWIKTPNMDRLASKSWIFDRSFSASYPTIPHRTDALTGRYGEPFHAWGPLHFDWPTLPRALAGHGYCTQLIHDTPHLVNGGHNFDWPFHAWKNVHGAEVDRPWIDDSEHPLDNWTTDPLFDAINRDFLSNPPQHAHAQANRKRKKPEDWNAAQLFLTGSEWLKDNATRDNFFLWLDCFDPHEPWDAPPEFVKLYDKTPGYDGRVDPRSFGVGRTDQVPPAAVDRVKAFYAAKVSWVDHWLGRFLDTLEETGLAKNTAILLTADHGTRLGEYGTFHKSYPINELEGHVPFILHVPGGGTGRSDIIVQPQDIFATLMAVAGHAAPDDIDSHDVLAIAKAGEPSPRYIAVSGTCMKGWGEDGANPIFTAFDKTWCLEISLKLERCALTKLGEVGVVTQDHPDVVKRLHKAGIDELERRGAAPALVKWLRGGGSVEFPTDCSYFTGYPLPAGYEPYFHRLF